MIISTTLILIIIILFVGSIIRATIGFGEAVIGMPLLALFINVKSATPLIALTASTLALIMIINSWRMISFKDAWRFIISTTIGLPIGLYYLKNTSDIIIKLILGLFLILFGIYYITIKNLPYLKTEKAAVPFGIFAGILGGAYNTNGPPTVIYGILRRWSAESFKATLQGIFFPTGLLITISHGVGGLWTEFVITSYLSALPFIILAYFLGNSLHKKINEEQFKKIIYFFIVILGVILIINSLC